MAKQILVYLKDESRITDTGEDALLATETRGKTSTVYFGETFIGLLNQVGRHGGDPNSGKLVVLGKFRGTSAIQIAFVHEGLHHPSFGLRKILNKQYLNNSYKGPNHAHQNSFNNGAAELLGCQ